MIPVDDQCALWKVKEKHPKYYSTNVQESGGTIPQSNTFSLLVKDAHLVLVYMPRESMFLIMTFQIWPQLFMVFVKQEIKVFIKKLLLLINIFGFEMVCCCFYTFYIFIQYFS